ANDAGQVVDTELRVFRPERRMTDGDCQLLRIARDAHRCVNLVEDLGDGHTRGPHRRLLDVEGPVADANLANLEWRPAVRRFWGLRLHQIGEVPSRLVLRKVQRWTIESDRIEDDMSSQEGEGVVVEPYVLQRDNGPAVHRNFDILHFDAEEQISI